MIDKNKIKFDSLNNIHWYKVNELIELFFYSPSDHPSEEQITIANTVVQNIDNLINSSLEYFKANLNESHSIISSKYSEISIILEKDEQVTTTIKFTFDCDETAWWWVKFNNPQIPNDTFWPVELGREQC